MARRLTLAFALMLGLVLPGRGVAAQPGGPGLASFTATLSVLAGDVRHVPAGAGQPEVAVDGIDLGVGDRVLTGPGARALVTFLDGSTVTVEPESDVEIRTAQVGGGQQGSNVAVQVNGGTVWARVVGLADPGSSFSIESNTASATVHSGRIGGRQNPDGSFVCWTKGGELTVEGKHGEPTLTLRPGQATTVQAGQVPAPRPFAVHQSVLTATTSAGVLPLVQMPDRARVLGFVSPGIEVNQVFGSDSRLADDGGRILEVPAGQPGPFTLVLEGQRDGPFEASVVGRFQGSEVYRHELSGTITKGERLSTEIAQEIDPATGADPPTARVLSGSIAPLQPLSGPLPGKILLSPSELETAGGDDAEGGSPAPGAPASGRGNDDGEIGSSAPAAVRRARPVTSS
jgi:hypothetical protein